MSIKSKVFATAAALTLVGGVGAAAAVSANAATPSAGPSAVDWYSAAFGTHHDPAFVVDDLRQGEKVGQPIILFRTSNADPAEDFSVSEEGTVADFYAAGLVTAAFDLNYSGLEAYEIQYDPYGVDSGLCVGTATTAAAGTKVSLQPCGVSSKTIWAEGAGVHGGVPLINGSDTNFSQPFALTYPADSYPTDMPRAQLYTSNLNGFSDGTIPNTQVWANDTGVLP